MDWERKWLGWICERKAAKFLKKNRYQIVKKNWRTTIGEIDLIAQKNDCIVFVEVKALVYSDHFSPDVHYDWKKQKKQILLGKQYLEGLKRDANARFDLIMVIKKGQDYFIEHLENVIDESS